MVWEIITAILAAIGVISLVWWASFALTRPRLRGPLTITVRPRGADSLQNAAIQTAWMRRLGFNVRLSVAVDEIDKEGLRMAQLFKQDNKAVTLYLCNCDMEDIYTHDGRETVGPNTLGHLQ